MPVLRKVWLHTSVVMPAALARRCTIFQALIHRSPSVPPAHAHRGKCSIRSRALRPEASCSRSLVAFRLVSFSEVLEGDLTLPSTPHMIQSA